MEDLSALNGPRRLAISIPNPAWLQDHRFQGRAVLPGVYALEQLAHSVRQVYPDVPVTACRDVRFDKFLRLPGPDTASIDATVDLAPPSKAGIAAVLLTRHVAAKSGISRQITHVQACFGRADSDPFGDVPAPASQQAQADDFQIIPERLYAELVPFGRTFRNIVSPVRIDGAGAHATVSGGALKTENTFLALGSMFPLDAVFHAACAWAQRFYGVVAFPVAMEQRHIRKPARCGHTYDADIRFRGEEGGSLLFDLSLRDAEGRLCEAVRGLVMRDVSGGKLQPPAWIRADLTD